MLPLSRHLSQRPEDALHPLHPIPSVLVWHEPVLWSSLIQTSPWQVFCPVEKAQEEDRCYIAFDLLLIFQMYLLLN